MLFRNWLHRRFSILTRTNRSRLRKRTSRAAWGRQSAAEVLEIKQLLAASLSVTGLAGPATAGVAQNVQVAALNTDGSIDTAYAGTVHFASSDAKAILPGDATLTNGVGTFSVTMDTAGTQTLTVADTANPSISGSLAGQSQLLPVYSQPVSSSATGVIKSSWYPPNGLDGDMYAFDAFTLSSTQSINTIQWQGGYTNFLSGAGQSPVSDFTVKIYEIGRASCRERV